MAKRSLNKLRGRNNTLGGWSFLVGLILAVLLGLGFTGSYASQMMWAVFLLGLLVGLLNITTGESSKFLTGGAILVLVSFLGADVLSGAAATGFGVDRLVDVLNSILVLFVPATIIVALRSVFELAKR